MKVLPYVNSILLITLVSAQHRAPPGVNPQQYHHGQQQQNSGQFQPPPPPPQQQQYQQGAPGVPPPQYQQPQQQQQQQYQQPPPPQQQFQQPPVAQPQQYQPPAPQHQQPNQHVPHNQQQQRVLHNQNLGTERDHIKDHLEVPLDTSGMSEEELQYHYFKMHDADSNNKLDGQELIKSLFHWHDSSNHDPAATTNAPPVPKIFTDEELVNMIDPILDQDDKNRDGFIDYPEFVQAQRTAAAAAAASAPTNPV